MTTLTTFEDEIHKESMSSSITTQIKSFIPQKTGDILPSNWHKGILKPIYDSSTISDSVNILEVFPPIPDPYWYLYDEDDYIGKIDDLDIHCVYTVEINPRESIQYDTPNTCDVCVNTGHTFDEFELLKTISS